ncbi:hypothetical protein B5X24_HaOG212513 [Helicoverpa armigera]|nr:hypothetical protein B5X24_HaOG212513 [Helicoverpa armigera]
MSQFQHGMSRVLIIRLVSWYGGEFRTKQDSAPSHKAKTTQAWLRENVPAFIAAHEWPSSSPDLNLLDYSLWTELELRACRKSHPNLESLKRALVREAKRILLEKIRAAIDDWPNRLRACIKNRGGNFE